VYEPLARCWRDRSTGPVFADLSPAPVGFENHNSRGNAAEGLNMQSVLELRKQQATKDRAALLADYREILNRWEKPASGDADRLAEIQQGLGLSDRDVEQDYFALCELRKTRAAMLGADGMAKLKTEREAKLAKVHECIRALIREAADMIDPAYLFRAADDLIINFVTHSPRKTEMMTDLRDRFTQDLAACQCEIANASNQEEERNRTLQRIRTEHPRIFG
jgi:hypothetical protein